MNTEKKRRLLFVGFPPTSYWTGQGRVARSLIERFKKDYEVGVAGWGCKFSPNLDITIYPDSEKWWEVIPQWKPDILFLSHDVWRFPQLPSVRQKYENLKIVGYFTIDSDPIHKSWLPIFGSCDIVIVPSMWGKQVLKERFSQKPIVVIPNGIEINQFYKHIDKEAFKEQVDKDTKLIEAPENMKMYHKGKFTILFAGANQSKKNIGTILDGFCLFAKDKIDVLLLLVLHSFTINSFGLDIVGDYDVTDMYSWRRELKKINILQEVVDDKILSNLYLISDVLLSPSIGEGFGLFVLEAMATGAIPIITDYSAFVELPDKDSFFPLKVDAFYRAQWNAKRAIVSAETVASTLDKAYYLWKNNLKEWKDMMEKNWQKVFLYSWDKCAIDILQVLKDVCNNEVLIDPELQRLI